MTAAPSGPAFLRNLRLATGLILFTYVSTHLVNHALGLVSLSALEAGQWWFKAVWRHPLATTALYGALVVHAALALTALYRRSHLRMPAWEATQMALGLTIPVLLFGHMIGTRLAAELYGLDDSYGRVVLILWAISPHVGERQLLVTAVAWAHGCMGLHFWLRLRPGYRRLGPTLLAVAVLLPVLAALGFVTAGREAAAQAADPARRAALLWSGRPPLTPAQSAALARTYDWSVAVYGATLGLVLVARGVRAAARRRRVIRLTYPGRTVVAPAGVTILEASRLAGIPHASVCGGRGRCSTCRVAVTGAAEALPPASDDEVRVLRRVGAGPRVRLACQLRPTGDVTVSPLVKPTVSASAGVAAHDPHNGSEQEIAILFADLRGFTSIAERKLPYDVVFLLNRYFETVGVAINRAGGVANQFTGDGVMALFGIDAGAEAGCRHALAAAVDMVRSVDALSEALGSELPAPLRIGIGIHTGPAVVGRMGYAEGQYLTAVGDTVNAAARLEQLTKEYDCPLIISDAVAARAGLDASPYPGHVLTLRNRAEVLPIRVITDIRSLPLPR
ncbi:MAG TPA: adenylate/guanylate cyclase domain-containing protein [Candidatus Limnocylindria bacterium]|nr:adenylate/guanylate cyclase domain-containing protein [Candidatus Limnocylindria bacterium]